MGHWEIRILVYSSKNKKSSLIILLSFLSLVTRRRLKRCKTLVKPFPEFLLILELKREPEKKLSLFPELFVALLSNERIEF